MYYCTLFNRHYLSRGLALYRSLVRNARSFHLYIFAFDDETVSTLKSLQLSNVTVISLGEFETPELLAVKKERTMGEYCWTCTPAVTLHCLEKYNLPHICYLDADLYFWQDPQILINEAASDSLMITEHRYTPEYDQAAASGKYCVQFMYFKNNAAGLHALTWWRDACIEWCYDRVEEGKFGDQKYLDNWPEQFTGVRVLVNLGGGVAPWNVQQYRVVKGQPLQLQSLATKQPFDLIFYHFHALKFVNDNVDFGGYKLSKDVIQHIYRPYVKELLSIEKELFTEDLVKQLNIHGVRTQENSWRDILRNIKQRLHGVYNCFPKWEFTY